MRPIFSPASGRRICNQGSNQLVGPATRIWILSIEHQADYMVHFSHSNDEGADKIEPEFFASSPSQFILRHCIVASHFSDRTEEEMCSIWQPVDPFQLISAGYPLESFVSRLEDFILWHVFGEIEPSSRNLGERRLDNLPHH